MSGENKIELEGIKRKKEKSKWIAIGAILVVIICIVGGGTYLVVNGSHTAKQVLKISGSTTVQPIVSQAAENYMNNHSNVDIQVSGGGSSVGITAIGQGTVDIGMSSRDIMSSEIVQYPKLVKTTIADDGVVFIVHPSNSLNYINLTQLRGIYNGTYTNWKQFGGADKTIVVYGRDSSSGTRQFVSSTVMKGQNFTTSQLEQNSNGAIQTAVAQTEGAIGYVGMGYVDSTVKGLKIDNGTTQIEATVANVLSGTYPLSRQLYMITQGASVGLAKDFIDYILSPDGQNVVQEEGFVPLP